VNRGDLIKKQRLERREKAARRSLRRLGENRLQKEREERTAARWGRGEELKWPVRMNKKEGVTMIPPEKIEIRGRNRRPNKADQGRMKSVTGRTTRS